MGEVNAVDSILEGSKRLGFLPVEGDSRKMQKYSCSKRQLLSIVEVSNRRITIKATSMRVLIYRVRTLSKTRLARCACC